MKVAVTPLLTSSSLFAYTAPLGEMIADCRLRRAVPKPFEKVPPLPGLKDVIAKTLSAHDGNAVLR